MEWTGFLLLKCTVTSEIFHGIRYRGRQQLNAKPELPVQSISWHCLFWNKSKNLDIFMAHDNDLIHFLLRFLAQMLNTIFFSFFLYNKQLNMYLCIPAQCFPSPYRKQTLAGSVMTWSYSQECFPSIKRKKKGGRRGKKKEKIKCFFSVVAPDRRRHEIRIHALFLMREDKVSWSFRALKCTDTHAPLPSLSWRSFSPELSEAVFPPCGKFQCWDVKPWLPLNSLPVTACTRWAVMQYFLSWWAEMKQKPFNSKRKRSHSPLSPTPP